MRTFSRGETIVVNRRVPRYEGGRYVSDVYGVLINDVVSTTYTGVAIWPSSNTEVGQNQERTSATYTMALPDHIDVDAVDYVTWRGKDYELRSELEFNTNPNTGTRAHTVAMVRVEG